MWTTEVLEAVLFVAFVAGLSRCLSGRWWWERPRAKETKRERRARLAEDRTVDRFFQSRRGK